MAWDTAIGQKLPNDAVLRSLGLDIAAILRTLVYYRKMSRSANDKRHGRPLFASNCIRSEWIVEIL